MDKKIEKLLSLVNEYRTKDGYNNYVTYYRWKSSKKMTLAEDGKNGIFYVLTDGKKNIIEYLQSEIAWYKATAD